MCCTGMLTPPIEDQPFKDSRSLTSNRKIAPSEMSLSGMAMAMTSFHDGSEPFCALVSALRLGITFSISCRSALASAPPAAAFSYTAISLLCASVMIRASTHEVGMPPPFLRFNFDAPCTMMSTTRVAGSTLLVSIASPTPTRLMATLILPTTTSRSPVFRTNDRSSDTV